MLRIIKVKNYNKNLELMYFHIHKEDKLQT